MRKATLVLTTAILFAGSMATPANAIPAGWFHLRGTVKDDSLPFALRAMDVQWPPDGKVTGFVRMNASTFAKDSQLWKARYPRTGRIGDVRLENKLTGQCISRTLAPTPDGWVGVTIRPCSDPSTIWSSIARGRNKYVFRTPDGKSCLTKMQAGNRDFLRLKGCGDFIPEKVWEAYISG
jgi:hypothetical protein